MTLYELTGQYLTLKDMAEDGDIDPDVLKDTLEGVEGEIEMKAENIAKILRMLSGTAKVLEEEEKRIAARRKSITGNMDRLKLALEQAMQETGKKKFKTDLFSFYFQKSPAAFESVDESAIPAEFWKERAPKLDKVAAKAYIEEHGEQSWGRLKQTESLRIK